MKDLSKLIQNIEYELNIDFNDIEFQNYHLEYDYFSIDKNHIKAPEDILYVDKVWFIYENEIQSIDIDLKKMRDFIDVILMSQKPTPNFILLKIKYTEYSINDYFLYKDFNDFESLEKRDYNLSLDYFNISNHFNENILNFDILESKLNLMELFNSFLNPKVYFYYKDTQEFVNLYNLTEDDIKPDYIITHTYKYSIYKNVELDFDFNKLFKLNDIDYKTAIKSKLKLIIKNGVYNYEYFILDFLKYDKVYINELSKEILELLELSEIEVMVYYARCDKLVKKSIINIKKLMVEIKDRRRYESKPVFISFEKDMNLWIYTIDYNLLIDWNENLEEKSKKMLNFLNSCNKVR